MLPTPASKSFEPITEYSSDGNAMSVKMDIPKESLEAYKVSVEGKRTITVQYGHSEEKKSKNSYYKGSYSRSFSQTTDREIKTCDARIEGDNTLLINVEFEERVKPKERMVDNKKR